MAIRAHDELAGDGNGTQRAAGRIGQERDRARPSVVCVKTPGTVAGFTADHGTGTLPVIATVRYALSPLGS